MEMDKVCYVESLIINNGRMKEKSNHTELLKDTY